MQGQGLLVRQVADEEGAVLQFGGLEEGAVEVRHVAEALRHTGAALLRLARQHLEEEAVEVVVITHAPAMQEGVGLAAAVVGHHLGFKQLQEEHPVHPGDA